ncbi:MAG: 50S ribosomal protein L23 [Bradymonadales bacterium]|nr:50S ribosomal protein L23 [Bradymonadales bacterium]
MKTMYDVIRRPIRTEKSTDLEEANGQVVFEVDRKANKVEIRQAVERLFGVTVIQVNTMNRKGKPKRFGRLLGKRSDTKKAIVTLAEGSKIEFFEGA